MPIIYFVLPETKDVALELIPIIFAKEKNENNCSGVISVNSVGFEKNHIVELAPAEKSRENFRKRSAILTSPAKSQNAP